MYIYNIKAIIKTRILKIVKKEIVKNQNLKKERYYKIRVIFEINRR